MYADGYCYADGMGVDAVIIQEIFGLVFAGRDGAQEGAHHFLGIDKQIGGGSLGAGDSVALADFAKALGSSLAGGDLCAQVAFAFFGSAHVVQQQG